MDWVVDSSVALAWALPDEASEAADRFLARLSRKSVLWVPALWWYEVANGLTTAQRRARATPADGARLAELYGLLPVQTDLDLRSETLWRLHSLAIQYDLSAYDAAYLELALRRGIGLATLDRGLRAAARKAHIKTVPM